MVRIAYPVNKTVTLIIYICRRYFQNNKNFQTFIIIAGASSPKLNKFDTIGTATTQLIEYLSTLCKLVVWGSLFFVTFNVLCQNESISQLLLLVEEFQYLPKSTF